MKASDRKILFILAGLGLIAGLWMLVISPKRSELSDLDAEADALSAEVSALESEADAGKAAKAEFPKNYSRMVVLGKAVPADDEEADLIVNLNRIGGAADVEFRSIALGSGTAVTTPEISAPNPATGEEAAETAPESGEAAPPAPEGTTEQPAAAAPTEASAAGLPIGATVGPAGLGVMPWDITFDGDYFDLNRVFAEIDRLVHFDSGNSKVNGRLVTVDGFALERVNGAVEPRLKATVALRSFVAPQDQGLMLGATPQGPAPATTVTSSSGGTP